MERVGENGEPVDASTALQEHNGNRTLTTSEQLGLGSGPPSLSDRIEEFTERLDQWRDRPAAFVVVALVVLGAGFVALGRLDGSPTSAPVDARIPQVTLAPTTATVAPGVVVVHVSGAVIRPGVYTLDSSARVVDAIEAAGGASSDAELHRLNLAALLIDGEQISVPRPGEELPAPPIAGDGPIDLNRADAIALQELPGVGPATAAAIVNHREEYGPFQTVDDLLDVPGIGPAKLAALADAVVVR